MQNFSEDVDVISSKQVDIFHTWLLDIEVELGYSIKALRADRGGKFILIKLKA